MLSSLRDKILNVKQNVPLFNIDEGLKTKDTINLYAGADILKHFQDQWEEMHKHNEDNAKRAAELAQQMEQVSKKILSNKENVSVITYVLSNSNLSASIANCLGKIMDLYTITDKLENNLIELEVLIDETEFQNLKFQHQYHLTQYQLKKEESLASFKNNLEKTHSKKVTEYEAQKKSILQERQKVFQDAFKTDLELYKSMGTLPDINQTRKQNGALLEEIQLDYDQSELDQFFSDNA